MATRYCCLKDVQSNESLAVSILGGQPASFDRAVITAATIETTIMNVVVTTVAKHFAPTELSWFIMEYYFKEAVLQ